jgi:hypothetical protein
MTTLRPSIQPNAAQPTAKVARIGVLGNSDERGTMPGQLIDGLRRHRYFAMNLTS